MPPNFVALQKQFAAHVRDGQHQPKPKGIPERRMQVYQELIYNNLESFLSSAFPVMHTILDDEQWHTLINGFVVRHKAHSPLFREIPPAFIDYLETVETETTLPYPFLIELAHYEYLEAYVMMLATEEPAYHDTLPALDDIPMLAPALEVAEYTYPVHEIYPEALPSQPLGSPIYLSVYRKKNDLVGFEKLSPLAAMLLVRLTENSHLSIQTCLKQIAVQTGQPADHLSENTMPLLKSWYRQGLIWGTKDR